MRRSTWPEALCLLFATPCPRQAAHLGRMTSGMLVLAAQVRRAEVLNLPSYLQQDSVAGKVCLSSKAQQRTARQMEGVCLLSSCSIKAQARRTTCALASASQAGQRGCMHPGLTAGSRSRPACT